MNVLNRGSDIIIVEVITQVAGVAVGGDEDEQGHIAIVEAGAGGVAGALGIVVNHGEGDGLAIAVALAERNGGHLEFRRAEPHGLIASVILQKSDQPGPAP